MIPSQCEWCNVEEGSGSEQGSPPARWSVNNDETWSRVDSHDDEV